MNLSWFAKLLVAVSLVSALATANAAAQVQELTVNSGGQSILVKNVFVNVTGDPKLAHRMLTFINLELEDASFLIATTEANADAEIDAELTPTIQTTNFGLGLLKSSATAEGKTDKLDSCESLSTSEQGEFFGGSAARLVTNLREKYPSVKRIELDPASDEAASKVFAYELANSLKESGFEVVSSGKPDVSLHVDLERLKVPIEERLVKYKTTITLRDGTRAAFSEGTKVLSARASSRPEFCPDRVDNLDWLTTDDPLFRESQSLIKQLRAIRSKASNKISPKQHP